MPENCKLIFVLERLSLARLARTLKETLVKSGSLKKQTELRLGQHDFPGKMRVQGRKEPILQPFRDDDDPGAIIYKGFARCSSFIQEHKQVTRKRVFLKMVFYLEEQRIKGSPHISGFLAQKDLCPSV